MKAIKELKRLLSDELDKIVAKGDISPSELGNAKHIVEIFAMMKTIEDSGVADTSYSGRRQYDYMYPSWGYGRSYDTPEYPDYGRSYTRPSRGEEMGDRYSGHEPMEYIISELRRLHAKTSDDKERNIIADCIEQLER